MAIAASAAERGPDVKPDTASYRVTHEKVLKYADAVHESDPIYRSSEHARAAAFRAVVAPPMFAVVYSAEAVWKTMVATVGSRIAGVVHLAQEFTWFDLVHVGDVITTRAWPLEPTNRAAVEVLTFASESRNQLGALTASGKWTIVLRGEPGT